MSVFWSAKGKAILVIVLGISCLHATLAQQKKSSTRELNFSKSTVVSKPEESTVSQRPNLVVQLAHVQVHRAAFSGDGRLVLTCGDQTVVLWDVASARELRRFSHPKAVTSIAFSPDGRFALSGCADRTARLWDVATGLEVRSFSSPSALSGAVTAVAYSPDGRQLLTGSEDGRLIVWDVATGAQSRILDSGRARGPASCITTALFSPDGRYILSGSLDCRVGVAGASARLFEAATGKELHRFEGFSKSNYAFGVTLAIFSPDSRNILLSIEAEKSKLELFDLTTMQTIWALPNAVNGADFSPDGKFIATATIARALLLDAATGKEVRSFYVNNETINFVTAVAFSPDGKFLLTGFKGNALLWDVASGEIARRFEGQANSVSSVAVSPDGRYILSEPDDPLNKEIAVMWDTETGQLTRTFSLEVSHSPINNHPAFSPDGRSLLTSDNRLWDLSTEEVATGLKKYVPDMLSVAFSPDGRILVIGDRRNKATLIDVRTGAEVRRMQAPVQPNFISDMSSVAFSPDGRALVTGSGEAISGNARLWDVESGKEMRQFASEQSVTSTVFSPDGNSLLVGSSDGAVTLWNRATGTALQHFQGHHQAVNDVTFSSDGRFVLTASADDTARMWDPKTGKEIRRFEGHAGGVHSARFSPDGRFVWTGARDFTARLWNASTGQELCRMISFRDGNWVTVDPEGRFDTSNLDEIRDLHWVMPDEPFRPLPVEIFLREYYEPRLLQRIIAGENFRPVKSLSQLNRVQPVVHITNIEVEKSLEAVVSVSVEVSRAKGAIGATGMQRLETGVFDLRIFRDGQLVGLAPDKGGEVSTDPNTGKALVTFTNIKLPRKADLTQVEFSAYAFNVDRVKSETDRKLFEMPKNLTPAKGRAYVISFGVNAYEQQDFDLNFAANDARRVQDVVLDRLSKSAQYDQIVGVSLLSDYETINGKHVVKEKSATRANLKAVFDLLSGKSVEPGVVAAIPNGDKLRQATPDDLVLISFSSHGFADDGGNFYFVPYDTGLVSLEGITPALVSHCISSDELAGWLRKVDAGEMVMIVDACHSAATVAAAGFKPGPMGSRGLGQLAYDKRMRILTSTQADDVALESGLIKQGLLTYALTHDGIEARQADFKPKDNMITLAEWLEYGVRRVPGLYDEVKKGELQSFGLPVGKRALVHSPGNVVPASNSNVSVRRKGNQQPSLFDFSRKKYEVALVKGN